MALRAKVLDVAGTGFDSAPRVGAKPALLGNKSRSNLVAMRR
jgi:hypothetical protein